MTKDTSLRKAIDGHQAILRAISTSQEDCLSKLTEICVQGLRNGNSLLVFGNGGSAATAQHLACELVVKYSSTRSAISAIALTTDSSILTAIGNDFGFEYLFSRQIEALAKPGDIVVGITTSSDSPNIIAAFSTARNLGCVTVALTGNHDKNLLGHLDIHLSVPSNNTARVQEIHSIYIHVLCEEIEKSWC